MENSGTSPGRLEHEGSGGNEGRRKTREFLKSGDRETQGCALRAHPGLGFARVARSVNGSWHAGELRPYRIQKLIARLGGPSRSWRSNGMEIVTVNSMNTNDAMYTQWSA